MERRLLYLLLSIPTVITVLMEPKEETDLNNDEPENYNEAFGTCLSRKEYGTIECINRGALTALESWNHQDNWDFGEMHLERADGYEREVLDWNYDPKDFGNIVKAAARLMERRSFKWNLDNLYPGLQLRAGPMLNGNGVLEFVINERVSGYIDRQANPGRQLTKHLLLPFLLGFKFSLASLIPLLFGLLLIVTKKALLLTKIAIFISGLLGWNSLFSAASNSYPGAQGGFNGIHSYPQETPVGDFQYYEHQHHFPQRPYRMPHSTEFPYGPHVIREVVNVYERDGDVDRNKRNRRNFLWTKNIGTEL